MVPCASVPLACCQIIAAMSSLGIGVPATCVDTAMNGTYTCTYVPAVAGSYLLVIQLDGLHVRNSPYAVTVAVGDTNGAHCIATAAQNLVRVCSVWCKRSLRVCGWRRGGIAAPPLCARLW